MEEMKAIELHMTDSENLNLLSEKILPNLIYAAAVNNGVHAAAVAAAVVGSLLQAVFTRLEVDSKEEGTPHGPRS